jgi:hypothetical protein
VARTDQSDAKCLRDAAWILRTRAKKVSFNLRVVIMVLESAANRIDKADVWADVTGQQSRR